MWIVDDDGDMFNTDLYERCIIDREYTSYPRIVFVRSDKSYCIFGAEEKNEDELKKRYYNLVEKLTGERI